VTENTTRPRAPAQWYRVRPLG